MKLIIVCNNYGQRFDGIGAYAHKVYENFDIEVFSAITKPDSKIRRVFCFGMSMAALKASCEIMRGTSKRVVIEYPFVEWNPMIFVAFLWLKLITIIKKAEFITSIHEFKRVNKFRKLVIILLAYLSDKILVTERDNFKELKSWNKKIYKIDIPSNIEFNTISVPKNNNQFVFFGLVNKAKAFDEMLDAWDEFNNENKFKLIILSASQLENMECHANVEYIYNADDKVVEKKLFESTFAIVPIKPYVDEKNATFKAGCLAGCISIGKFCDEYKHLRFVFDLENYDKDSFVKCFKNCSGLCINDIKVLKDLAVDYSKKFTINNTRSKLENVLFDSEGR